MYIDIDKPETYAGTDRAYAYDVYLDGEKQHCCKAFDTEAGWVEVIELPPVAPPVVVGIVGRMLPRTRRYGKVEVFRNDTA